VSDRDLLVMDVLEEQVPFRLEAQPDWRDVLGRAGVDRASHGAPSGPVQPRRQRRRLVLAVALVALAATAASPLGAAVAGLGRDAFDGLSSWLRGQPGQPAPQAEQSGFVARNDASYAAFPKDTKLRLLTRERVGGRTFSLLGFRNGSSLCLRLVRADRPAGRGPNQCVTLLELRRSRAPAIVAADAWFRIGNPETSVEGIFGFADDTVRQIEVERARGGRQLVDVALATGTVNGQPIFGHGVADVEAALGRPDRVQTSSISNGHGEPTLYPPWRRRPPGSLRLAAAAAAGDLTVLPEPQPRRAPARSPAPPAAEHAGTQDRNDLRRPLQADPRLRLAAKPARLRRQLPNH
jgi:hypothetical protein